ncbi:YbjN domain-containing protein [Streptomyces sp. NPDC047000]|uniref:YbjN domain-containing protein n=1 Tax=Streptomyces sp. NPDC047000 TaxID=3155474 RepID=UPI0033C12D88
MGDTSDSGADHRTKVTADRTDETGNGTDETGNGTDDANDTPEQRRAREVVEHVLKDTALDDDTELDWESPESGHYVVRLPGTRKLSTTVSLLVGRHTLSLNAFVIRHPDENEPGVHRWLLEHNLKLYGVSYAIDPLGDIYVAGKLPLAAVTPDGVDRLLGQVLEAADGAFDTLLELGFATAIRKEYAWRVARGESTRNLDAFTNLIRRPGE